MKPLIGYAPMLCGRILIDQIVTYSSMRRIRCRSKIVSTTGRITRKWGPETSWSQHWKNKGAQIVKVRITCDVLETPLAHSTPKRRK